MELNKSKRIVIVFTAIFIGSVFAIYLLDKPYGSIINYFPYINGFVFFLSGLCLFLFSFRIYRPKYKTVEQALKFDNMLRTWGNQWKFGSIVMILFGAYTLIRHDPNMYRLNSTIENNKWTDQDKTALIKNCMKGAVVASKNTKKLRWTIALAQLIK